MSPAPQVAVVAAGTVCWHLRDGRLEVLVVHRERHSDVSLPKGKVDAGESVLETAVRETLEETGLRVALGIPLGVVEYTLPNGRDKTVHYWAAEVSIATLLSTTFTPNDEVSAVKWMSPAAAIAALSYQHDRDLVDRLLARYEEDELRTFAIIALRHGKAAAAGTWAGPDSTRSLETTGVEQARRAASAIAAYRPAKLISSTAARCVSTIEPLARITGLDITATTAISQDAHDAGRSGVRRVVAKRIARRRTVVLCSHGPVLPEILHEIATLTEGRNLDRLRQASLLATGEFSVIHVATAAGGRIVAIESHSPTPRGASSI